MISFTRLQSSELARFQSDVVCAHFCRSAAELLNISIRKDLLKCYEEEPTRSERMSNFFTLIDRRLEDLVDRPLIEGKICPRPVSDSTKAYEGSFT